MLLLLPIYSRPASSKKWMEYDPFEKVTDEKIPGCVDLVILLIADPLASEFD